ncbi:hypothetical protein VVR12_01730 [Rothia sp. LK2588]|uniref:hypothetical protein n=1 Tax=Rothia sp. LK2588 TaxID=3114369 RepID=UPI0034CEE9FE
MNETFRRLLRAYPGFFERPFTIHVETIYNTKVVLSGNGIFRGEKEKHRASIELKTINHHEIDKLKTRINASELTTFIQDCLNYLDSLTNHQNS